MFRDILHYAILSGSAILTAVGILNVALSDSHAYGLIVLGIIGISYALTQMFSAHHHDDDGYDSY